MSPRQRETKHFPLKGGINTESSALVLPPGQLIDARNYEQVTKGGYRRVEGYERFDGKPLASEATYYIVPFNTGTTQPYEDDLVKGSVSQAEGHIIEVVVESGAWATNDATGYFVVSVHSGTFVDGEVLTIYLPEAFSTGFSSGFF